MYNFCTTQDFKEISIHLQRNLYDLSKIWVTKLQMKLKIIIKEREHCCLRVEHPRKLIKLKHKIWLHPWVKVCPESRHFT